MTLEQVLFMSAQLSLQLLLFDPIILSFNVRSSLSNTLYLTL